MSCQNLASAFVDLATYDDIEVGLYGSYDATTPFVLKVNKATWFTTVPVALTNRSSPAFGQSVDSQITRGGDYLLQNWVRFVLPSVSIAEGNAFAESGTLRWTRNLGHNIIDEVSIKFNEMCMAKLTSYFLDFWAAFTVPAGKRNAYDNMIGNIDPLTNPTSITGGGLVLPSAVINVPLPLPHCRDSGVSLPTAAIPYNEMLITVKLRNWTQLLILDNGTTGASQPASATDVVGGSLTISDYHVWGLYSVVSNDERSRMGRAPRDILIEQVQIANPQSWDPQQGRSYDVHFAHSVKALFFGARCTSHAGTTAFNGDLCAEWSNYTCAPPVPTLTGVNFRPANTTDPFESITMCYENTDRLRNMPIDYFSLICPFYSAVSIPLETGYHVYTYTLDLTTVHPLGSTNFGKLTNVSIQPQASSGAITAGQNGISFRLIIMGLNHNRIRVTGGAVGFPTL